MKFSLRTKTALLIILATAVLGTSSILISSQALRQVVNDTYRNSASGVASTMAAVVDGERVARLNDAVMAIYHATNEKVGSEEWGSAAFNTYSARFAGIEQNEDFLFLRQQLRMIQDVNDVDCLYLSTLDSETANFIYLVDGAYEHACPPGCIDPLLEENHDLLTDPTIGFPPYISNTQPYGWLVTAGAPIYDKDGGVICYAMVDITMEAIRARQAHYVLIHSTMLAVLTVLVCVCAIWAVNRAIIRPINLLSSSAAHYNAGEADNSTLENLPIKSNDEIQSLYESMRKMTEDIHGYIDNLVITQLELKKTRIKADVMNDLALKDALTSVGSKLAYDQQVEKLTEEMERGDARFGIVVVDMNGLKTMNDTYGHEQGNLAIKKTCALICDVFAHSPVYRFGGDEFVVVIKGRDYDNITERIREFDETAKAMEGQPWEKVNAAVGYALYNGEDTVIDVFRKADHRMYECKTKMKQQQGGSVR
ncbi:MAG: GGDEF domain-containing protein [bacterium]